MRNALYRDAEQQTRLQGYANITAAGGCLALDARTSCRPPPANLAQRFIGWNYKPNVRARCVWNATTVASRQACALGAGRRFCFIRTQALLYQTVPNSPRPFSSGTAGTPGLGIYRCHTLRQQDSCRTAWALPRAEVPAQAQEPWVRQNWNSGLGGHGRRWGLRTYPWVPGRDLDSERCRLLGDQVPFSGICFKCISPRWHHY